MIARVKSCSEARRYLDRYLDGELPHKVFQRVEKHVSGCVDCDGYVNSARSIGRAMKTSTSGATHGQDASDKAWNRVMTGLERKDRLSPGAVILSCWRWLTFYPRPVWFSACAAAALIVVLFAADMGDLKGTRLAHPMVEYVESQSSQVLVFSPEGTSLTVIWVFEPSGEG